MLVKYIGFKENFKYQKYDFSKGTCELPDELAAELISENPRSFAEVTAKVVNIKLKNAAAKAAVKGTVAGSKATVKPEAA